MNEKRNKKGQTLEEFLADYDMSAYDRPSVTVDNVIIAWIGERPAVLLIRRGNHPFIGRLALPGGFLERNETLEQGALRELYEETGVEGVVPVQLGAYGDPDRDPRGWIVTVAFIAQLPAGAVPKAADDAADAGLYLIDADAENGVISLTHSVTGERTDFLFELENGRAKFIPNDDFAGDHTRILTDALLALGLV